MITTPTKKVGITGKFGVRYGRKPKIRVANIEKKAKDTYKCPECGFIRVKRLCSGIWFCRKCEKTFSGGSYTLKTPSGELARRQVNRLIGEEEK